MLSAFASQKQHLSLYVEVQKLDRYRQALAGLNPGRSSIRFRELSQLPLDTVRSILNDTVQRLRAAGVG